MSSASQSLSRTSSASSFASDDTTNSSDTTKSTDSSRSNPGSVDAPRRTRKRFTNVQLMMLEHLYHQTSHPTREQRESLARDAKMEMRSVTVWFQNKRQTERRVALNNASNGDALSLLSSGPSIISSKRPRTSRGVSAERDNRTHIRTHKRPTLLSRHLSLDHIASRAERPCPPRGTRTPSLPTLPSTPPRRAVALWENMPSSPPASPDANATDPQERTLVDFGRGRLRRMRTLEWACAAARVEGRVASDAVAGVDVNKAMDMAAEREPSEDDLVLDLGGDTEDEHEAITPQTASRRLPGVSESQGVQGNNKENVSAAWLPVKIRRKSEDVAGGLRDDSEDVMNAALALCGLGGRT